MSSSRCTPRACRGNGRSGSAARSVTDERRRWNCHLKIVAGRVDKSPAGSMWKIGCLYRNLSQLDSTGTGVDQCCIDIHFAHHSGGAIDRCVRPIQKRHREQSLSHSARVRHPIPALRNKLSLPTPQDIASPPGGEGIGQGVGATGRGQRRAAPAEKRDFTRQSHRGARRG